MNFFDFNKSEPKVKPQAAEETKVETQPTTNVVVNQEAESVQQFNALKNASTQEMVQVLKNQKAMDLLQNDEATQKQIEEHTKQEIADQLDIDKDKTANTKAKTKFEGNEEACKVYGVEKSVPLWQQKMMSIGAGIWFVIYFIFASFTVAPLSTFALKLNVIFKKMWVSIAVAIGIYVVCAILIPFLLAYLT